MSQTQDIFGVAAKTVLNKPMMQVQDRKSSGTDGGTSVAGNNDRDLNTVISNDISGASLLNNEVTLPAGEYYMEAFSTSRSAGIKTVQNQIRKSDDTVLLLGHVDHAFYTHAHNVAGKVVLTEATAIKVSTYINSATATDGLGVASDSGEDEIFTDLRIWKLDSNIETPVISDPTLTLARPLMHVQDQKPSGTGGGTGVSGYNDRDLNTILKNDIVGAFLAANEVTLPAGTYYIEAESPGQLLAASAYRTTRLFLTKTDDTVLLAGMNNSVYPGNATHPRGNARVSGTITLTGTTTVKLRHYLSAYQQLGYAASIGVEVYSELKIWQLDAVIRTPVLVNDKLFPLPGNVMVTGNMHGLDYAKTADNEITIQAGICMDSTNETVLQLAAPQVLSIPAAASTIYNLFLCDDGFVRQDTDVNGANLVGYKIRWLGFVLTDGSGNIYNFSMQDNRIYFGDRVSIGTTTAATTYVEWSLIAFMPVTRVNSFTMGITGSARYYAFSTDGVIDEASASDGSASTTAFSTEIPSSSSVWTRSPNAADSGKAIRLGTVTLKR